MPRAAREMHVSTVVRTLRHLFSLVVVAGAIAVALSPLRRARVARLLERWRKQPPRPAGGVGERERARWEDDGGASRGVSPASQR